MRKIQLSKEYTCGIVRTSTTESLLAETDEQVETEITVSRFVEVFQPPRMCAVVFDVLRTIYNLRLRHP